MLGSEACPLTGEFAQAFRMHALGAGRVEADGAQAGQLLDHACEGTMAWGTRRLTRPGQHAHRSALFDQQQRIEGLGLFRRQVAGQLLSDTPLGQHRRGRNQLLDDGRAGCDQTVPAQLIHERRGDRRGTRGGNRHWHQPGQGLAAARGREVGEAECLAQGIGLLVAGLEPLGVSSERRWFGAEFSVTKRSASAGSAHPAAAGVQDSGVRRVAGRSRGGCGHADVGRSRRDRWHSGSVQTRLSSSVGRARRFSSCAAVSA